MSQPPVRGPELVDDDDFYAAFDEVFQRAQELCTTDGFAAAEPVLTAFADATLDAHARLGRPRWVIALARRLRRVGLDQGSSSVLEIAAAQEVPPEGGNPPPAADILLELADNLLLEGHTARAVAVCDEALALLEPGLASHDRLRFEGLNLAGTAVVRHGDLTRAKALVQESLELGERIGAPARDLAVRIDNLGTIEIRLADNAGPLWVGDLINEPTSAHLRLAERLFGRAQELFAQSLPDSRDDYVVSLMHSANLAERWRDTGHLDALSAEAAEVGADESTSPLVRWLALTFRGRVLYSLGRAPEAVALITPLLADAPDTVPPEHIPDGLAPLLLAAVAVGDQELAHFAAVNIATVDDRLLEVQLAEASEAEARYLFDDYAERTELILGHCLPADAAGEAATWLYDLVLNRKGILAERQGSAWLAARYAEGAPADLLAEVRRLRSEVARMDLAGPRGESIRSARRRHAEAEQALSRAETRLHRAVDAPSIPPVTVDQVRACLAPDTVLLDLTCMRRPDGVVHYLLFQVHGTGLIRYRDLGPAEGIDDELRTIPAELKRSAETATRTAAMPRLFGPEELLPTHLIVSPTRLWGLAPFCLLPGPAGRPLIDDHIVTLVPSARWLVAHLSEPATEPATEPTGDPAAAARPVVIGDPDFDAQLPEQTPFLMRWRHSRLPYSADEARETGTLLGVAPVVGAEATRHRLLTVQSPTILHIASHGVFLDAIGNVAELSEPRASMLRSVAGAIVETEDDALGWEPVGGWPSPTDARAVHRGRVAWLQEIGPTGPATRSSLLLAGVNAWLAGAETDDQIGTGMVTAAEFALLDLSGTGLVVLSACQTGVGAIDYADGSLLGLRSAALAAGAACCVASLWAVDDETTTQFMSTFYQELAAGAGRSTALRTAQLALRRTHPDPYHWACWVAEGDAAPVTG